ncbi:MAG: dTDP-4-dehydrorhamnose reductase [Dehalococcoidia bacterium]|nr:dTDP-4-dehydrorhamnose reductase [Dehalococcoidia bacterium]
MRVLVLGANGQLGSDVVRLWRDPDLHVVTATHAEADVTDAAALRALVERARPDVVLNTTAFHNLPVVEDDPETALRVNAVGGWQAARAAAAVGAAFVQLSTDYVFDGEKRTPYLEDDPRRALNVYAATKIAAEDLVRVAHPRAAVVRVAGLFGLAGSAGKGGNFVETMLRLAAEGRPVRVVDDQVTAPTNTAEVAEALLPLVRAGMHGVYHLAPSDSCSWYTFAAAIFALTGRPADLQPVTTARFGAPVRRPAYSVLGTTRAPALRPWRAGLERYLREKGHIRTEIRAGHERHL